MHRKAFALRELTCLTALTGIALSALIPVAAYGAGQSRLQVCMTRLKSIGKSRAMFALDHADGIASLESAVGSRSYRTLPTQSYLRTSTDESNAATDHAVDIIQARGARRDFGVIRSGWMPALQFNHLALADYRGESLPSPNWACPEDAYLLTWQSDPRHFWSLGVPVPFLPGGEAQILNHRWVYASSYVTGTSTWSNDRHSNTAGAWYFQGPTFGLRRGGVGPQGDVGHRRLAEVAFPASKIDMWDRGARHFVQAGVRGLYWGYDAAKHPALFFDGVVRTVRTGSTNPGWDPDRPDRDSSYAYQVDFSPREFLWHPGPPTGDPHTTAVFNAAHFAATRNGLAGNDLR